MKLVDIRIRNFRSVEGDQHFMIPGSMTLVGPNNSGKTNLLKAIQTLFTGYSNSHHYSRENDLTFGVGTSQTSITATFEGDSSSYSDIYDGIDELHSLQGTQRQNDQFTLNLYFTGTNTPVYGLFPNIKRPKGSQAAQYSRTHKITVNKILSSFRIHYVPAAKNIAQIYDELLNPFLRSKVADAISPSISLIHDALSQASESLNQELKEVGLGDYQTSFSLPNNSMEELVSGFDFLIADPQQTPIKEKGMGVQAAVILAAFRWITEQEEAEGKKVIWLLEEPESYLHPNLASNCSSMLERLAQSSIVIKTTHSMAFVPQDPQHVRGTRLTDLNRTEVLTYKTFTEATSSIRSALGIRFSDFYNLAEYNIFVEGPSDRELFTQILNKLPEENYDFSYVRKAKFEDFGGVKFLSGFLRSTYEFIRTEYPLVSVFDGDPAGDKERRDLQQYFGQKQIPFQANLHYVSVRDRFAIEGLFPDTWIVKLHEQHESWFDNYSLDASGTLEPFRIKDNRKSNAQGLLMQWVNESRNLEWAGRFIAVFNAIDTALRQLDSTPETNEEPTRRVRQRRRRTSS